MPSKQYLFPVAGILSGALVWGLIWYPYRVLQEAGVSGPVATLITYLFAMLCGAFMLPRVWRELRAYYKVREGCWAAALVLSAGWSNLGYVLAMLHGEVMRVLLLFYLAPLWTILFSYWILDERLNRYGYAVIALSFGAASLGRAQVDTVRSGVPVKKEAVQKPAPTTPTAPTAVRPAAPAPVPAADTMAKAGMKQQDTVPRVSTGEVVVRKDTAAVTPGAPKCTGMMRSVRPIGVY